MMRAAKAWMARALACAAAAAAVPAVAADAPPAAGKAAFGPRHMSTLTLGLRNGDFGDRDYGDGAAVPGWIVAPGEAARRASLGEGREGSRALVLDAGAGDEGEAVAASQDLPLAWPADTTTALSVSAWVWSDTPQGALLRLSSRDGREALSAFHSGASRWEYLTVVFPYDEKPGSIRLSLVARKGAAKFTEARALQISDDRFTKKLPDSCNPLRERATYAKGDRIRIVIVGNSTVNGHAVADKRATFPYVLQQKLEAIFPGRFDVVNFGICGWHLPPQVITLDKTYNSNKACDGATWCGGKDGQFSHRNALAVETNADDNTPTIAALRPDVIVFAGMWNDVWRALKYAGWGIPPNPDEVRRDGETPLSVEYLRSVFEYADHPTAANLHAAEALFEKAMRPLDAATLDALRVRDVASLRQSAAFEALVANARRKFAFLSAEFMRRAARYGEVWSLALPGRFGDAYEDAARRFQAAGLLTEAQVPKYLVDGYIDGVTERIQDEELARVSRELGAKELDLSAAFHGQYGSLPTGEQFALGYFLDNVEDNVHFTYRGNEWIADRMFLGLLDDFTRLSKDAAGPTGGGSGTRP